MANRNNVSASQVDILEQWLNVDLDSDEGENGENWIITVWFHKTFNIGELCTQKE